MTFTSVLVLLTEVRACGVELRAGGDGRLRYRPKGALDETLLSQLVIHKPEILALLAQQEAEAVTRAAAEIAWRVAVLRYHVECLGPLDPIRLPPVREDAPPLVLQDLVTGDIAFDSSCGSCGEPRETGQIFICRACQQAHQLVLLELGKGAPATGDRAA